MTKLSAMEKQQSNTKIEKRLASVELHMKGLADALKVKIKDQSIKGQGFDEIPMKDMEKEDRKRLKQRLKDAIEYMHETSTNRSTGKKAGWTEHIFGICRPDGRVGKEGSRSLLSLMAVAFFLKSVIIPILTSVGRLIHPQSRFMQGVGFVGFNAHLALFLTCC